MMLTIGAPPRSMFDASRKPWWMPLVAFCGAPARGRWRKTSSTGTGWRDGMLKGHGLPIDCLSSPRRHRATMMSSTFAAASVTGGDIPSPWDRHADHRRRRGSRRSGPAARGSVACVHLEGTRARRANPRAGSLFSSAEAGLGEGAGRDRCDSVVLIASHACFDVVDQIAKAGGGPARGSPSCRRWRCRSKARRCASAARSSLRRQSTARSACRSLSFPGGGVRRDRDSALSRAPAQCSPAWGPEFRPRNRRGLGVL